MILKVTLKVHSLGTLTLDRRFEQRPGGLREALTIKMASQVGTELEMQFGIRVSAPEYFQHAIRHTITSAKQCGIQ